jgi:hypothetical protein
MILCVILLGVMVFLPHWYHSPMTTEETTVFVVVSHAFAAFVGFLVGGYAGARGSAG